MFRATLNRGFQMTFSNGYTISCQWGGGNYCSRYGEHPEPGFDMYGDLRKPDVSCEDCEVAIWHKDAPRTYLSAKIADQIQLDVGHDDTMIYCATTNDVAKLITYVSALPGQQ